MVHIHSLPSLQIMLHAIFKDLVHETMFHGLEFSRPQCQCLKCFRFYSILNFQIRDALASLDNYPKHFSF